MDTILTNSENGKESYPPDYYSIFLNLKRKDKYIALSNLTIYYTYKNI